MRQRAASIGGQLEVTSAAGTGTKIRLTVSLRNQRAGEHA